MKVNQDFINEALNCAVDNGYTFEGWTPEEIVADLLAYCDMEGEDPSKQDLLPMGKAWLVPK